MSKKLFATLLSALLANALFCLPVIAAPTRDEMDGMTPYGLTAEAIPGENRAALLTFQVVGLGAGLPGMEPGDDINIVLEYKRGAGDWTEYDRYGSRAMLDDCQTDSGEFQLRFVFDTPWDGAEPVHFHVHCEYMQGGDTRTGLTSSYSNVVVIGGAGEGMTEPATVEIVPIPYDEAEDIEEPIALPTSPGVSHALLLCFGVGLLLVLLIIIIVVISKKKKRK